MSNEQKHAIEHAQKVLRAVKLYELAASLGATQGADARPVAIYQVQTPIGRAVWLDVDKATYDYHSEPEADRRIVYAARDATPTVDARPVVISDDLIDSIYEKEYEKWEARKKCAPTLWHAFARAILATRDAGPSDALKHDAWKEPFAERHEFDTYPDHFMTGLRNEFAAGWHAAIKASAPRKKT